MSAGGSIAGEEMESSIQRAIEGAGVSLQVIQYKQLSLYLSLMLRWNARINLTSVREPGQMISRHLVESIVCALALPPALATLLDFGSGAGLPGIPIAICRPEIKVTLAEAQNKKAGFLQEAIRVAGLNARVHSGRAEEVGSAFDCVAMRAVDQMERAIATARSLVAPQGWMAILTSLRSLSAVKEAAGEYLAWKEPIALPGEQRVLLLGKQEEI